MSATQSKSKRKKYAIYSPDGFTIDPTPFYTSQKKAIQAFNNFLKRYERQGYYSSVKYGRIEVADIDRYCNFVTI
jgi:hypothetical protein